MFSLAAFPDLAVPNQAADRRPSVDLFLLASTMNVKVGRDSAFVDEVTFVSLT